MRLGWDWILVRGALALVFSFVLAGIHLASQALATRGVRVTGTSCAWEQDDRYVATVSVANGEDVAKAVSLSVQGRFTPDEGRDWPSPAARRRYSAFSQPVSVLLPPRGERTEAVLFTVPGAEGFACSARAFVNQQRRMPRHA
jgi:hypothetical protein